MSRVNFLASPAAVKHNGTHTHTSTHSLMLARCALNALAGFPPKANPINARAVDAVRGNTE